MNCDVLLVDDNPDLREVVTLLLDRHGFTVRVAEHGSDALALLENGLRPSVILLDLMMPVMDGLAFRSAQRKNSDIADIPVVVVSAAGIPELVDAAADVVLTKPVEFGALVNVVASYCSARDRQ